MEEGELAFFARGGVEKGKLREEGVGSSTSRGGTSAKNENPAKTLTSKKLRPKRGGWAERLGQEELIKSLGDGGILYLY